MTNGSDLRLMGPTLQGGLITSRSSNDVSCSPRICSFQCVARSRIVTNLLWFAPFVAPVIAYYNNGKDFNSSIIVFLISITLFGLGSLFGEIKAESKHEREFAQYCQCNWKSGNCRCKFPSDQQNLDDRGASGMCGKFCGE